MSCLRLTAAILIAASSPSFSQLTADQKNQDFLGLASVFAKRYGPANWKIDALSVNLFDVRPWLQRVAASRNDLEFYEVMLEYVTSLQDGHSRYFTPSNFTADLGLVVDIFDNRLLIEAIDRARYPAAQYPFQVGDELVSIDGKPAMEEIRNLMRFRRVGTERGSLRLAADLLVFRPQSTYPKAVELPDVATVQIQRANGALETYELTWFKQGLPLRNVSPVPGLQTLYSWRAEPDPERFLAELWDWRVDPRDLEPLDREYEDEQGNKISPRYIQGWGTRSPYYQPPPGFVVRRGNAPADTFFSGTYEAGGRRIGLLRIPNFGPANPAAALGELEGEIRFFQANTDGLVLDVSRNTGGGCIGVNYLSYLIPRTFTTFREQYRPTQSLVNSFETNLRLARQQNRPQWVIDTLQFYLDALTSAALGNRAMTGPLAAACASPGYPVAIETAEPARAADGALLAYTKPLIVLADELSVSFGDMFPAMLQDNRRGKIVGMRTGGWGGSVSGTNVGFYSEGRTNFTNSLVVRWWNASAPGLPTAPYIENIGVQPDIELDYMTRENLVSGGRPFVQRFTEIILAEIAAGAP